MADVTYKTIKKTEYENRGNAPIYIDTSEVLKEAGGKTALRLKLYNNCGSNVRSAYLNVGCFDKDLNLCVQLKNLPYVNVNAKPATMFGEDQLNEAPELTQSVFVEVAKVLFEDGTSWVNPNQSLADDIVSEEALGEEWLRLRLTKEIKDKNSEKKQNKKLMSENRKLVMIAAVIVCAAALIFGGGAAARHFSVRSGAFKQAMNLYINRDYSAAAPSLAALDEKYNFSGNDGKEIKYCAALSYMNISEYGEALKYFHECGDYKRSVSNMRSILNSCGRLISAGYNHSAAARKNGTVAAFGDNGSGQCDTGDWTKIIAVSAGGNHTVGMTYDGYLTACGDNEYGQCDVSGWTDIVAVSTGEGHTIGLKANGRVVARGNNNYGQCDVQEWDDIVQVAAAGNHTIGLKSDGTVLATGWNEYGQCDVEGEKNVLRVATGEKNTVLIKYDGSVKVLGDDSYGQKNTAGIKDAVSAAVGSGYIVYCGADGKAVSVGDNSANQGSLGFWDGVIAVACGNSHSLGLSLSPRQSVLAVGNNSQKQLDITSEPADSIGPENIQFNE